MTTQIAIDHLTHYHYSQPVQLSPHMVRLRPAPHTRTPIHAYRLTIQPSHHFIHWQQDPFGNWQARLLFSGETSDLSLRVELRAELLPINPFDFFLESYAAQFPFHYDSQLYSELPLYLAVQERGPLLQGWLQRLDQRPRGLVDFLVELNSILHQQIRYTERLEPGIQDCEETLAKGSGSCRDSTWLLMQTLRHLGLAARFCSGYLVQLADDPAEDFSDLHAWAEVYAPGAGWIGLDPTSGLLAGEGHIPLACTPHPISAAPVTGHYLGSGIDSSLCYESKVLRVKG